MDATAKIVIGNLGLAVREAEVRRSPDEFAPVVHRLKPNQAVALVPTDDPYWLKVVGKHGDEAFVRSIDVIDLGYPLRRTAPARVII